ncbi:portal capping protein [Suid betaherpesvirus 2]|uniref:Portal capping protein n=1 Tax=Suid betaherpesvirus 2 TaxID=1608255 RepID=U3GTE2_9BETA|nr:portal capping protein [Suid betaherpesvirus 2]AGT99242.1 portal capping protein [Suid betaherpesvirus 2]
MRRDKSDAGSANKLGITQIDPHIEYVHDFRGEIIFTFFSDVHAWSYTMGPWYYKIKQYLFYESKWKRRLKIVNVESLSISQELLTALINAAEKVTYYPSYDVMISDLEAAACILISYYSVFACNVDLEDVRDAGDVFPLLSAIFKFLADDIVMEQSVGDDSINFGFDDPEGIRFYTPINRGKHYHKGTFDNNILMRIFLRREVFGHLPRETTHLHSDLIGDRMFGAPVEDRLLYWTKRFWGPKMGHNIPNFVQDQHYLRSGITAIQSMFLLWKVLNSESVFGAKKGKFFLSMIFSNVDASTISEVDFQSRDIRNFEYLVENYVTPVYRSDSETTISKLFPGLVLLMVNESISTGWEPGGKQKNRRVNILHVRSSTQNPIVEYMFSQISSNYTDIMRLEVHDKCLFHFEHGLNELLLLSLPKNRMLSVSSSLFNVRDIYEFLYFLVLGFLPIPIAA